MKCTGSMQNSHLNEKTNKQKQELKKETFKTACKEDLNKKENIKNFGHIHSEMHLHNNKSLYHHFRCGKSLQYQHHY